jgi:release factor glutamine methyltransferase
MEIYEPAEDSYLLQKYVEKLAEGRVLDLGTGSGIQALTAVKKTGVKEVIAVDLNKNAVNELNEKIKKEKLRKIKVVPSDLFEHVSGKFNSIIFNPPYLPQDKGIDDLALYGGKKGWEISAKFFSQVSKYLMQNGKILFLFSTLTNKDKIEELIKGNLLEFKELGQQKISFETLFVYEITKTDLLQELERKQLENIHHFTHGRRGAIYLGELYQQTELFRQFLPVVYTKGINFCEKFKSFGIDQSKLIKTHLAERKKIKVAIKVEYSESKAINRINNEIKWLKVLNQKGIGPKLLFYGKKYFVYKFVEGEFILDWLGKSKKKEVLNILNDVLNQCFVLDKLSVNKEEMHHPFKHVIIDSSGKPVMLDFERCNQTKKPKNVTQFVEFICRIRVELKKKKIIIDITKLRELASEYKKEISGRSLEKIKNNLSS